MTRILFVDDEPAVLDGLRDLLRRYRNRWELEFAHSGDEALSLLSRRSHEVVVTDLRMPGMDGAALLEQVRARFPQVCRVVLSGQADREAVVRCVPVAHQFLSKPCDPEALPRVIERALQIRARVGDEALRVLIAGLGHLPTPPRSYFAISRALASPDAGLDQISRLVEADPASSAKVLQLANSAFFGRGREVSSVGQAVTHLGGVLIRDLVLSSHLIGALEQLPCASARLHEAIEQIQLESGCTARLAQLLRGNGPRGHEAFTAGLLHALGKVVAVVASPERYEELLRQPRGPDLPARERALFGFTHTEAGGYLLGLWGLPAPIVDAAANYLAPGRSEPDALGTVGAVHVAAALVAEILGPAGQSDTPLDRAWLQRVHCDGNLDEWRELARHELAASAAAA